MTTTPTPARLSRKDDSSEEARIITDGRAGDGRYDVIYMDPPWFFADQTQKNSGASDHYPLMQDDELRAFGATVDEWSAPSCALSMWASGARLDFAFELLRLWGFRFVTTLFVWVKLYPGCGKVVCGQGRYTRSSCEYVILGARGSIPVGRHDVPQLYETEVVAAPRSTTHSEKPDEFRERIAALWPDARRLEVFCRHAPEGWDAYGDQVGILHGGAKQIKAWRDDGQQRLFEEER
jgi:N6-adenosine-specific RNA methylase IME4